MYGKALKETESLKYLDVVSDFKSISKSIRFKAKDGCSLKKAAEEAENFIKDHKYAIEEIYGISTIGFAYNDTEILIKRSWNASQIGHSWMLENQVENEIKNCAYSYARLENADNAEDLEMNEQSNRQGSVKTNFAREFIDRIKAKFARKKINKDLTIKSKQNGELNVEVQGGTSIQDVCSDLVMLFKQGRYEKASFTFNGTLVVVNKNMSVEEMSEAYYINVEMQHEIKEKAKDKQLEILEKFNTENIIEN